MSFYKWGGNLAGVWVGRLGGLGLFLVWGEAGLNTVYLH